MHSTLNRLVHFCFTYAEKFVNGQDFFTHSFFFSSLLRGEKKINIEKKMITKSYDFLPVSLFTAFFGKVNTILKLLAVNGNISVTNCRKTAQVGRHNKFASLVILYFFCLTLPLLILQIQPKFRNSYPPPPPPPPPQIVSILGLE